MNENPQRQNGFKYVTYKWLIGTLLGSCVGVVILGAGFANAYFYSKTDGSVLQANYSHIKGDVSETKQDVKEIQQDIQSVLEELRRINRA